jgi:succinate dehydrogenase flavin-adding protein (antitoxin of CptAB toxin-antitoxin module)
MVLSRKPCPLAKAYTVTLTPATAYRLEVDILLGTFASLNVDKMNDEEMRQYEDILNQETVDIFNFITGKDEIPEVSHYAMHCRYFRGVKQILITASPYAIKIGNQHPYDEDAAGLVLDEPCRKGINTRSYSF